MTQDHLTSLLKLPSNADALCVDLILEMVVEVGGNARSVTQFECPECSPPVALCKPEGGACFSRWHHVITIVNRMLLISLGTLIKGKTTLMHERNFPRSHQSRLARYLFEGTIYCPVWMRFSGVFITCAA